MVFSTQKSRKLSRKFLESPQTSRNLTRASILEVFENRGSRIKFLRIELRGTVNLHLHGTVPQHPLTSAVWKPIIACLAPAACSSNHIWSTGALSTKFLAVIVVWSSQITTASKCSIIEACSKWKCRLFTKLTIHGLDEETIFAARVQEGLS